MTIGPWDACLATLRTWDPQFAAACFDMTTNPWSGGVLSAKFVELVCVGLNIACTNLNADGTRRHIRAALEAGASRDEILFVMQCAAVMSIHSCSLGAPILLEEAAAAGVTVLPVEAMVPTPACDRMKAIGQWNVNWDPFLHLDPQWTDLFMANGASIYGKDVMPPKELELLSVALDASFTHMFAPGVRRHVKAALRLGATPREVMEVLKLCVVQGVQALNLGVPILAEELMRRQIAGRHRDDGARATSARAEEEVGEPYRTKNG